MINFLFIFIVLNSIIILSLEKLSKSVNIYDKPDNLLKKHKSSVPLIGGVIMIINILAYIILEVFFNLQYFNIEISKREFMSLLFFIFSFFLIGLYDDKYKIKPERKFFISILISIFVLSLNKNLLINNITFSFYDQKIFLNNFKYFFTIFCIIILLNSLNFYDGTNGQLIIFFIIIFSFLGIKSPAPYIYILIDIILLFLLFLNLKNKIFLGDNGVFTLSSLLIILIVYEHNQFNSLEYADEIFLLLILPGIDLVRLTISRIFKGKNAFYGDRKHIHHLLTNKLSLTFSNIILSFLIFLPIILFSVIKISFFISLSVFLIFYSFIVIKFAQK